MKVLRLGAALGTLALSVAGTYAPSPSAAATTQVRTCALPTYGPGGTYHPRIDPSTFTPTVTNRWFPLTPGTTLVYTGVKDGQPAVDVFAASTRTRVIDHVRTRVVEDRLFLNGRLEERTSDYYAQDACGNVWYFGEDTAVLDEHGHVIDTSGSFHAGMDGAQPGVYMQARPEENRRFRQEWYRGQAEDTFRVVDRSSSIAVPYGAFSNALRTAETTRLEPGVLDNKYYVRGIGEVEEVTVTGPAEKLVLVDVIS